MSTRTSFRRGDSDARRGFNEDVGIASVGGRGGGLEALDVRVEFLSIPSFRRVYSVILYYLRLLVCVS